MINLGDDLKNRWKDGDLEKADVSDEDKKQYDERITQKEGFLKRGIEKSRKVLAGENVAGKIGGKLKDVLTRFGILPKWMNEATDQIGDSLKQESKSNDKPMLSKILSVKNFINMKDENGNFSWQELGASLLQIVLAGAIVYGAVELGIWNELKQILGLG